MTTRETQSGEMQQRAVALLPFARRIGLRVFVLGALVQTVAVYLFAITVVTFGFYRRTQEGSEIWSWEGWKETMNEQLPFWIGIAMGGLALAVVSMPFGSWTGKMIGIRKRRLAWVGPLAAVVPSLVAGLVLVVVIITMKPTFYESYVDSFVYEFLFPVLFFSLLYYLPGIVTSLLGGLVIRQKMKSKTEEFEREMALQQQHE
jgi:hypothetical protein